MTRLQPILPIFFLSTTIGSLLLSGCVTLDLDTGDEVSTDDENNGSDGSDQDSDDNDGDGLSNTEEAELGTDPNKRDTDDDTYWDSWEVTEGTDPLDPDSRIYTGYWPYNPDKDSIVDPGWTGAEAIAASGGSIPRFSLKDQYGEMVDMYDYGGHSISFVLDFSALWCAPCRAISEWLAGGSNEMTEVYSSSFPTVPEKVNGDKIYWVTILGAGAVQGSVASEEDVQTWDEEYPHKKIVVLADTEQKLAVNKYVAGGWPAIMIVNPEMKLSHYPDFSKDPWSSLRLIDTDL